MKAGIKHIYKPTPKQMVKLGNALHMVSLSSIPVSISGHEVIGYIMLGIGVVGNFITTLFADE